MAVPKNGYPDPSLVATTLAILADAPTYIHLFKTKEKLPVFFSGLFCTGWQNCIDPRSTPAAKSKGVGVLLASSFLATVDIDKR